MAYKSPTLPSGITLDSIKQKYQIAPLKSKLIELDIQIQRAKKQSEKRPLQIQYDAVIHELNELKGISVPIITPNVPVTEENNSVEEKEEEDKDA